MVLNWFFYHLACFPFLNRLLVVLKENSDELLGYLPGQPIKFKINSG